MDVGLNANDRATVWVHDFKGHPIIEHDPQLSLRKCTIKLGEVEIVIFRCEEEDHGQHGILQI